MSGSSTAGTAGPASINPAKPRVRETSPLGSAVERDLSPYEPASKWVQDPSVYEKNRGDHIENQKVMEKVVKTVKLTNVVPPIHYSSGEAKIPQSYVGLLRDILARMKDRKNVRLHFVGHSDNVRLMPSLQAIYVDNVGLSRERAGTAAEFFQQALGLPAESISYEGMGDSQPVASNATDAGKAKNRRVEVQVWYDVTEDKPAEKQVVVQEKLNRVKVCRVETLCKLSYKEDHAKRTRIKNLVQPLHFSDDRNDLPAGFVQNVLQAYNNLSSKQNVVIKLVGYSDNAPLSGRDERIYGDQLGLSKARARRVALALQDALKLPSAAIASDGRGSANPIAPNETEAGRALNRRVEVEFWYDDMLQELPDGLQLCPAQTGPELVTKIYESPSGPITPLTLGEGGKVDLSDDYMAHIRSVMAEVAGKDNVRLRFIGYTKDERLDRRAAMIYGDDIGLSTARARHVMDLVRARLALSDKQVEFEGHGFVQTDDVVNAGFVESKDSRVEVQVVYDEMAPSDDADSVDVQPLKREISPVNPYALNLMRITVDGRPVDDPQQGSADVQRCTDVALEQADVQFKYDTLNMKPRLNVTAWPNAVRYQDDASTEFAENRVQFQLYSNFRAFIDHAEVRLFDSNTSLHDKPLAVVKLDANGRGEWLANFANYQAPGRELKYLVRVYDTAGHYDETSAQSLWVLDKQDVKVQQADVEKELLVGYGENRLIAANIPLDGGTIKVHGDHIPEGHKVWVAGRAVPVADKGDFADEEILPSGLHTVEVAVLDNAGNGDLFLRDLELEKNDWFYVGIADATASKSITSGPAELVSNDNAHYDNNLHLDGRLAFFTQGKFGDAWKLTASADTLEGPMNQLFSNFLQKTPDSLFRRIDPDYYYPTYGDDSTVEELAPTLGKFYVKLQDHDNYGMWGNFKASYLDNTLAQVDRDLYGGNLHLQSADVTSFGEKRFLVDGFAAEPGTVAGRDEYLGTGGSLYYLRHQDILTGSERIRIEVRDKVSGVVLAAKDLTPSQDYDIDYLQGRIMLTNPLSATSNDGLLVSSGAGVGNDVHLVVRYEYTTGFDDVGTLSTGGRVQYWLGDMVKVGVTADRDNEAGNESNLTGADVTVRKTAQTWVKAEVSSTLGQNSTAAVSNDGGYQFAQASSVPLTSTSDTDNVRAGANRVDASVGLHDFFKSTNGTVTLYRQQMDAGYSAPGQLTATNTELIGGTLQLPVTDRASVKAKIDRNTQDQGLQTEAKELDVDYHLTDKWMVSSGMREENRQDNSPIVPLTQIQGDRTDATVRATYDSKARWTSYGYVQDTLSSTGNEGQNGRVGAGGTYRVTDHLKTNGEASFGDLGTGAKAGTEYLVSDRTNIYTNYALENERTDTGMRAEQGTMSTGFKTRYSDTTSVYAEEKYAYGDVPTGLTHSTGVDLAPFDHWNFGANMDVGTLHDNETGARMDRKALGVKVGYGLDAIKAASALEFRIDGMQNPDLSIDTRHTWVTKNSVKYQINPDWRFIGKFNYSQSKSSMGEFYDGSYTEIVAGYGYRPVLNDRLDMLFKYTYFYNMPTAGQVTVTDTATEFIQKSNILSLDTLYDLNPRWTVGGKYAYRLGQVSEDRVDEQFFESRAALYILRADWHVIREWDAMIEGRLLDLPDAQDRRSGMLLGLYRHINENVKLGGGYNFTSFSDDLTDLSFKHRGFFINVIGKF